MITHGIIVDRWLCKGYSLNIPFRFHFSSLLDGPWPQPVGIQGTVAQAAAGVVKHISWKTSPCRGHGAAASRLTHVSFGDPLVHVYSLQTREDLSNFKRNINYINSKINYFNSNIIFLRAKSTISMCHVQWFSIANCEFLPEINHKSHANPSSGISNLLHSIISCYELTTRLV